MSCPERARRGAIAAYIGAGALVLLACGVRIPEPVVGTEPLDASEAKCVDAPPPTVIPEELPPRPSPRAVWVDGAWGWADGKWAWQPGGWIEPPPGSTYRRERLARLPNGALVWYPGRWHTREEDREARAFGAPKASSGPIECPAPGAGSASVDAGADG